MLFMSLLNDHGVLVHPDKLAEIPSAMWNDYEFAQKATRWLEAINKVNTSKSTNAAKSRRHSR